MIAYSTFDELPPANTLFGRVAVTCFGPRSSDLQVLCTNPAALRGGSARLHPVPRACPSPPARRSPSGSACSATRCRRRRPRGSPARLLQRPLLVAGGAHVLRIQPRGGAPILHPSPDATWGLHLVDANIALGDLIDLVGRQARAYAAARG